MVQERTSGNSVVQGTTEGAAVVPEKREPRSLALASRGIRSSQDFAGLMSALMSDVIEGTITPGVTNAAVNAGGKLLKVVELQARFGTQSGEGGKTLMLCSEKEVPNNRKAVAQHFAELREKLHKHEQEALSAV